MTRLMGHDYPELIPAAYHEAGHAVMLYLLDKPFEYVEVRLYRLTDETNRVGQVVRSSGGGDGSPDPLEGSSHKCVSGPDAMVIIAGNVAERLSYTWGRTSVPLGAIHFAGLSHEELLEPIQWLMEMFSHEETFRASFIVGVMWERVFRLFSHPDVWKAIDSLARQLILVRSVDFETASRIIKRVLPSAKPGASSSHDGEVFVPPILEGVEDVMWGYGATKDIVVLPEFHTGTFADGIPFVDSNQGCSPGWRAGPLQHEEMDGESPAARRAEAGEFGPSVETGRQSAPRRCGH